MLIKKIISLVFATLLLTTMTACGAEDIPFKDEIKNIPGEFSSNDNDGDENDSGENSEDD